MNELFLEEEEMPLSERAVCFGKLLKESKVLRDPVHGDIWVTELEKSIIDTEVFQRLRRTRQLGPTHLVYPGAQHSRFEHSLGTLYVASRIAQAIRKNYRDENVLSQYPITNEDVVILRLAALLHDLAHLSFGHTLETEGALFGPTQWADSERRGYLCDNLHPKILVHLKNAGLEEKDAEEICSELSDILVAEELGEEQIQKLPRPYIADIVGNTICADLLDYIKRDSYFTGLKIAYDDRILEHFVIREYKCKKRAALFLERRKHVIRKDIISACIDLLKLRYCLAEKVYYHRVKVLISAMIIKMVHSAENAALLDGKKLLSVGDDELIMELASLESPESEDARTAQTIAKDLLSRHLYQIVYKKSFEERGPFAEVQLSRFRNADARQAFEDFLRRAFSMHGLCNLSPAAFIVYYPKTHLGKEADTKVFAESIDPQVQTIEELTQQNYSAFHDEIQAIKNCYHTLWQFMIILHPNDMKELNDAKFTTEEISGILGELLDKDKRVKALIDLRAKLKERKTTVPIPEGLKKKALEETLQTVVKTDPREYTEGDIISSIDKVLELEPAGS